MKIDNSRKFDLAKNYLLAAASMDVRPVREKLEEAISMMSDHPGGSSHHHGYRGGLVIHTAEVVKASIALANQVGANPAIVRVAAILHDLMKIYDYRFVTKLDEAEVVEKTDNYDIGNHIYRSVIWFNVNVAPHLRTDIAEAIDHCMIAHHSEKAWGSPVSPKTPEAWALHLADMASAKSGVVL